MALLEGKPLSNVDAAWLHMESPTNLMLISGVMSFAEKLDFSELKEMIDDRFCPRAISAKGRDVIGAGHRPRWVDDPHFNLRSHLERCPSDPGGQKELQEMVSRP